METLPYSKEELSSLNKLHIDEQAIDISLNPNFSIFHSKDDMHVIIGYEADHTFYNNDSKLVCGIVELKKVSFDGQDVYLEKLILPFSNKILFAKFDATQDQVAVVFKSENGIKKQVFEIQDEQILSQDFKSILDDDYPLVGSLGEYHVSCEAEANISRK